MSATTAIEWTDTTWNPIVGCSVVSPGCTNCYAMKLAGNRLAHLPAYAGLTQASKSGPVWTGEVRQQNSVLLAPRAWRKPRRVFVNSMSDLFHESIPDDWIDQVFAVMAMSPQHQFQVLTKRAARMRAYIERYRDFEWPLPNVWLGVSAEDQTRWDERVKDLIATPAAVRFVSAEPLLGPIQDVRRVWALLDWVIAGGESGPGARPMHPDWVRNLRGQCAGSDTAFFFKQWGEFAPRDISRAEWAKPAPMRDGEQVAGPGGALIDYACRAETVTVMRRVGKKAAGRLLDGRQHNAFPHTKAA